MYKVMWLTLIIASVFSTAIALAGSPHFVGAMSVECDGNTVTVSGKEAGLGNETQVHIELTASASCINPGGNHPQAGNKEDVLAEGDFPVQNGKANFSLTGTAEFQPNCSPPMSVEMTDIMIADTEHDLVRSLGDCP